MKKGTVYWITGLSGAGKTTLGTKLYHYLKNRKDNVMLLDGDILRNVFQAYDYSPEGRKILAFQYSRLCKMISDQGVDVVICTIAMYDDVRLYNRKNIENYIEIYLEVSLEELIRRDQKGIYTKAISHDEGHVVGLNDIAELPKTPDIKIQNYGSILPEKAFRMVLNFIQNWEDRVEKRECFTVEFLKNSDLNVVENICETLKCKEDDITNVEMVQSGLTNMSFSFWMNGNKYIYRTPGASAINLTDRKTEVYAQRVAKDISLDSSVIYIDDAGWKISKFINHRNEFDLDDDVYMKDGLQYLHRLHEYTSGVDKRELKNFDDFKEAEKLIHIASFNRGNLKKKYADIIKKVTVINHKAEKERVELGIQKCLCHNDVYACNYLYDGKSLYLIDWEYAGINDPTNDLACILCRKEYSKELIEKYIATFLGHEPSFEERRHAYAYIVICAFYWFCWGLYKGSVGDDDGFFFIPAYNNLIKYVDEVLEMYEE